MSYGEGSKLKLIETWLAANEGTASDAEIAQLNQAIVSDGAFCDHLLQIIQHQAWLQWNGVSEDCAACEASPEMASLVEALVIADRSDLKFQPTQRRDRALSGTTALVLSAFTLGACLAGVAAWGLAGFTQPAPNQTVATPAVESPQMRFVGSTQCLWDSNSSAQLPVLGQQLQGGESLHLLEGIAELSVASNSLEARLQLEGPVAVMFSSQGMPMLRYGKLTLKVDGFSHETYVVETPFGRVVAEGGSEVGISSMGSTADVHAFAGRVTVESPWLVSADQLQGTSTVHSGEALRIENIGGAVEVLRSASSREQFLPEVSMDSDHLVVGADYIREIRLAAPVAYWRFEGAEEGVVHNEMQDRFHGHIQRTVEWSGPRGNQAIQLGMSADPGSMVVNDNWDEVLATDFAIEAWIKPSHFHTGSIVGFVGEFNKKARKNTHGVLLEVCGIPHHRKSKSIRFLHRAPLTALGRGGVDCCSDLDYSPRRWQHLVAQRTGNQLQLFINGKLAQQLPDDSTTPTNLKLVMGQLYSETVERFFTGQVDEVAIYDRALAPKEVRRHYEILRPAQQTQASI